jgi:hypothetical protein
LGVFGSLCFDVVAALVLFTSSQLKESDMALK